MMEQYRQKKLEIFARLPMNLLFPGVVVAIPGWAVLARDWMGIKYSGGGERTIAISSHFSPEPLVSRSPYTTGISHHLFQTYDTTNIISRETSHTISLNIYQSP